MEIWIGPACSKRRGALAPLDAEGAEYTVRRHLDEVPTEQELRELLDRSGLEPWDIARGGEPDAEELGPAAPAREPAERGRRIAAPVRRPRLIRRPIITADHGSAVVARSDGAVREALARIRGGA
ncbi:arsenate reductase family protein [Streptomyces sanyensis]|uniref:arsenate reductase family protein n=1 Tax=Streptomyces sanyensis TaxID=568869 RepID=UPI003D780E27